MSDFVLRSDWPEDGLQFERQRRDIAKVIKLTANENINRRKTGVHKMAVVSLADRPSCKENIVPVS